MKSFGFLLLMTVVFDSANSKKLNPNLTSNVLNGDKLLEQFENETNKQEATEANLLGMNVNDFWAERIKIRRNKMKTVNNYFYLEFPGVVIYKDEEELWDMDLTATELLVIDDEDSPGGKDSQANLVREMQAADIIATTSTLTDYFLMYVGFVDVTDLYAAAVTGKKASKYNFDLKDLVKKNINYENYLVFQEKGEFNLAHYLTMVEEGKVELLADMQLRLIENIALATSKINDVMILCNLSTNNIFFEQIGIKDANKNKAKGEQLLELFPGEWFTVKFGDARGAVLKDTEAQDQQFGARVVDMKTAGFDNLPNVRPGDNADVFSVAMLFMFVEHARLYKHKYRLSRSEFDFRYVHTHEFIVTWKATGKADFNIKKLFENEYYYKQLFEIWKVPQEKEDYLEMVDAEYKKFVAAHPEDLKIQDDIPLSFVEYIEKSITSKKFDKVELNVLVTREWWICHIMIMSLIKKQWHGHMQTLTTEFSFNVIDNKIADLQRKMQKKPMDQLTLEVLTEQLQLENARRLFVAKDVYFRTTAMKYVLYVLSDYTSSVNIKAFHNQVRVFRSQLDSQTISMPEEEKNGTSRALDVIRTFSRYYEYKAYSGANPRNISLREYLKQKAEEKANSRQARKERKPTNQEDLRILI